jgi:uncharacterized protein (TIGR03083 family)
MQPLSATATIHLFPGLSAQLLAVLQQLSADDWMLPTACAGWSVKDLTAHLLGGNIGRLSFGRDRLQRIQPARPITTNADLVALINEHNAAWVHATQQLSPRVLLDFLAITDQQVYDWFMTLPMNTPTIGVGWAGETTSAAWFDIGREYTEKWFHQQQIREAVGVAGLEERHWLHPVIEVCLRALPYTYRDVEAIEGTSVTVRISGDAGGVWSLVRHDHAWALFMGESETAATSVHFDADTAWRLFSKGLDRAALAQQITIDGNVQLGVPIFDVVAIMA